MLILLDSSVSVSVASEDLGDLMKYCNKSTWHLVLFCDFLKPVFIQQESTSTSDVLLLVLRTLAR
jgi:hypothetical protein